jgi:hypothetical protein
MMGALFEGKLFWGAVAIGSLLVVLSHVLGVGPSVTVVVLGGIVIVVIYYFFFYHAKECKVSKATPGSQKSAIITCPNCGYKDKPLPSGKCIKCGQSAMDRALTSRDEDNVLPASLGHASRTHVEDATRPEGDVPVVRKPAVAGRFTLIKAAWSIYVSRFHTVLPFGAIFSACGFLFYYAFAVALLATHDGTAAGKPWLILSALPVFLVMAWSHAAMIYALTGKPMGFLDALTASLDRLSSYMGLCLLFGIGLLIGFLMFFIPGVVFGVFYVLAFFVFVVEGEGVLGSLRKSAKYVNVHPLAVFGRLMTMVALAFLSLYMPFFVGILLLTLQGEASVYSTPALFIAVFSLVVPFTTAYLFKLYEDLRANGETSVSAVKIAETPVGEAWPVEADRAVTAEDGIPAAKQLVNISLAIFKARALTVVPVGALSLLVPAMIIFLYILVVVPSIAEYFFGLLDRGLGEYSAFIYAAAPWMFILDILIVFVGIGALLLSFIAVMAVSAAISMFFQLLLVLLIARATTGVAEALRSALAGWVRYFVVGFWRGILIWLGSQLILPGMLFEVWYAFTPFVVALEGMSGKYALKRSKEYVEGREVAVFSLGLVPGVLASGSLAYIILALICASPVMIFIGGVVWGLFQILGISVGWHLFVSPIYTGAVVLTLFFSSLPAFSMIYNYLLYLRLKNTQPA